MKYFINRFVNIRSSISTLILTLLCLLNLSHRVTAQLSLPNIDFASGNFSSWQCYIADPYFYRPSLPPFNNPLLTPPRGGIAPGALTSGRPSLHAITSGTGTDMLCGIPVVGPGSSFSAQVGGDRHDTVARISYRIRIPPTIPRLNVFVAYAAVFFSYPHSLGSAQAFEVVARDSATGIIVPGADFRYMWLDINSALPPGYQIWTGLPWTGNSNDGPALGEYLPWTRATLNLSGMGGKTVILEVTASSCGFLAHFTYGYFGVIGYNDYQAPRVAACNLANGSITYQAPRGYRYYRWYNQNFSTNLNGLTDTSYTITLPVTATSQYYNLIMVPYSGGTPDTIRTNPVRNFSISTTPTVVNCYVPGTPVQLNTTVSGGAGNLKYAWTGSTLNASNIPNPIASSTAAGPGVYVVKVSDTNGCFRSDSVRLRTSTFTASAGPDRTICLGSNVGLSAAVSPQVSGYTYTWTPAAGLSGANIPNPVLTPAASGNAQYVLRVDSGACFRYDTLLIHTLPNAFSVRDTTVCEYSSVTPFVSGDTAFSYTWTPASYLTFPSPAYPGSDQRPKFVPSATTTFTITASYPGCSAIVRQLTVRTTPRPQVSLGGDTLYKSASIPLAIDPYLIPAPTAIAYSYEWSHTGSIDDIYKASIHFSGLSDTLLTFTVRTSSGCSVSRSVYIMVRPEGIAAMPNAFVIGSPTCGTFGLAGITAGVKLRSFRIYNRWGNLVFSTSDASEHWDGRYNGVLQPQGVFAYILDGQSASGAPLQQAGNVTLIRGDR